MVRHTQVQKHNILLLITYVVAKGDKGGRVGEYLLTTNHFAIGRWLILRNHTSFFGEKK